MWELRAASRWAFGADGQYYSSFFAEYKGERKRNWRRRMRSRVDWTITDSYGRLSGKSVGSPVAFVFISSASSGVRGVNLGTSRNASLKHSSSAG